MQCCGSVRQNQLITLILTKVKLWSFSCGRDPSRCHLTASPTPDPPSDMTFSHQKVPLSMEPHGFRHTGTGAHGRRALAAACGQSGTKVPGLACNAKSASFPNLPPTVGAAESLCLLPVAEPDQDGPVELVLGTVGLGAAGVDEGVDGSQEEALLVELLQLAGQLPHRGKAKR